MPWQFQQSTGALTHNGAHIAIGYSGHGTGLCNPAAQDQDNVGPLPQGAYTIGPPHTPPDHLGPIALPLYANAGNQMFGRFGFFIHGDNTAMNHTASDGCIILDHATRQAIHQSNDTALTVIA